MTGAEKVTVALSGGALLVAALFAWFARVQLNAARAANALTVLIDVFDEFRGEKLSAARVFVWRELAQHDPSRGFESIADAAGRNGTSALANC